MVKEMSQQIPPPQKRERYSLHMILFITSIILAVISLLINAFELILVNNYIMRTGGWGDIPMCGIPWIGSLMLLLFAILLGVFAELYIRTK
jgi:hypothetical protein